MWFELENGQICQNVQQKLVTKYGTKVVKYADKHGVGIDLFSRGVQGVDLVLELRGYQGVDFGTFKTSYIGSSESNLFGN